MKISWILFQFAMLMWQSGGVNPIRSDALCIANEISDSGQGETYPLLISLCIADGMVSRKKPKIDNHQGKPCLPNNPCIADGIISRKKSKIIDREGQIPPHPTAPISQTG